MMEQEQQMPMYTFIGIVEDRMDPEQYGRVRVRCFGIHSESKTEIPTEALPWAFIHTSGIGKRTLDFLKEGDQVFGYFLDAHEQQIPLITGCIQSFNGDLTPLNAFRSRSSYNLVKPGPLSIPRSSGSYQEPSNPFNAQYPYNHAIETESGHVIELDDTPGSERIHIMHKSGSFIEIHQNGTVVRRSVGDEVEISQGNVISFSSGDHVSSSSGDMENVTAGKYTLKASAGVTFTVIGNVDITASGTVNLKGQSISLN